MTNRPNTLAFAFSLTYLIALMLSISQVLSPMHTFFALQLQSTVDLDTGISLCVLSSIPALLLPIEMRVGSSFCLAVFFFIVLLPGPLLSWLLGVRSPSLVLCTFLVSVVFNGFARRTEENLGARGSPALRDTPWVHVFLYSSTFSFIIYMLVLYPGELRLVGFADVYALREVASGPLFTAYVYMSGTFANAIGPVSLVYGMAKKQTLLIVSVFFGYVLIYMASGNKSALISVVLMVVAYRYVGFFLRTYAIPALLTCLIAVSSLVDSAIGSARMSLLLIDRTIVAPGTLSALYFRYFSEHPVAEWRHSFLSGFSGTTVAAPASTIGIEYFGPGNYANASFIGDGFANFGWIGVAILLVVLISTLNLLDRAMRGFNTRMSLAVLLPFTISITNISPITALLTGGAVFLYFMLLAIRGTLPTEVEEASYTCANL